ncbi:hypothetical protein B0O99DRAFT_610637 [Bisporella sp. PMI_857]|nr:hypothetical protein B0O99DRAFT_612570 [Bisporella sp. PMI_857]KAH8600408.1 hypothetical protein B0O99DRAFT_610637 [Bisporella sp. PMI_857]
MRFRHAQHDSQHFRRRYTLARRILSRGTFAELQPPRTWLNALPHKDKAIITEKPRSSP